MLAEVKGEKLDERKLGTSNCSRNQFSSNLMNSAANYIAYCLSGLDRRSVDVHHTAFLSVS